MTDDETLAKIRELYARLEKLRLLQQRLEYEIRKLSNSLKPDADH